MKKILNILGVVSFAMCMGVLFAAAATYINPDPIVSQVVGGATAVLFSVGSFVLDVVPGSLAVGLPVLSGGNALRDVYNTIKVDRPQSVITYSYLRSEVDLTASQGAVRFPILVNDSPSANANERRLNIGDEFQITDIGILLYKTATGANRDGQQMFANPNPITFSKSGEAAALQALYNGFLNITVDRKEIIPAMDALQFFRTGIAQKGVLTAASGTNNAYASEQYTEDWGLASLIPTVRLSGAVVNDIVLNPSAARDMSGTTSTNTIVLFIRGFLIQGGAKFNG